MLLRGKCYSLVVFFWIHSFRFYFVSLVYTSKTIFLDFRVICANFAHTRVPFVINTQKMRVAFFHIFP